MAKLATTTWLGLAPQGIAITRPRSWRPGAGAVLEASQALDQGTPLLPALEAILDQAFPEAGRRKIGIAVVFGDALARFFMVTPPQNAGSLRDLQLAASLRFQALYGEAPQAWTVRAAWNAQDRFLACALRTDFHAGLHAVCRKHALHVSMLEPHFIVAWNAWRTQVPPGGWFGVVQDDLLSLGILSPAGLADVRCVTLSAEARIDPNWLPELLEREALRAGLSTPSALYCCGIVPQAWRALPGGGAGVHPLGTAPMSGEIRPGHPGASRPDGGPGGRLLASVGEITWH